MIAIDWVKKIVLEGWSPGIVRTVNNEQDLEESGRVLAYVYYQNCSCGIDRKIIKNYDRLKSISRWREEKVGIEAYEPCYIVLQRMLDDA